MTTIANLAGGLAMAMFMALGAGCARDSSTHAPDPIAADTSDAWITTKVRTDLLTRRQLSGSRIYAKTSNGVVTLSGTARNQVEIDRAVADAYKVTGVKSVISTVFVKS
ncbi:MAG TPA: BON domain-containing protein [Burkholderiales bacterium]|nr:BON domain-containing protein [Burkholderiales bacterium]